MENDQSLDELNVNELATLSAELKDIEMQIDDTLAEINEEEDDVNE